MSEIIRLSDPNDLYISSTDLRKGISGLADYYRQLYSDSEEVVVLSVRKGAAPFVWDLIRMMPELNIYYDEIEAGTMNGTVGGDVEIKHGPSRSIAGKDVLIGDDVFDRNLTMQTIVRYCEGFNPASLRATAMLGKVGVPGSVDIGVEAKSAIQIANVFVVGGGLDWNGKYRHLPHVSACAVPEVGDPYPLVPIEPTA